MSLKGLDNLGAAAKKCDMSILGNSVETVRAKFSAMEVVAMTTLSNITNSAVNMGKEGRGACSYHRPHQTGFQGI